MNKLIKDHCLGAIAALAFIANAHAGVPPGPGGAFPPGSAAAPNAVLGGQIVVATTGDVTATFVRGSGSFSDFLYLDNAGSGFSNNGAGVSGNWIFENHESSFNDTVDLGTWAAGTVLHFQVVADTSGTDWGHGSFTGFDNGREYNWYSGAGSLNADGSIHNFTDSIDFTPTLVGFEDLPGSNGGPPGDANYEDIQYTFSNTRAVGAPDSGSVLALFGLALTGLGAVRRRLQK